MDNKMLFNEIDKHLMGDDKPSVYLNKLLTDGELCEFPFTMVSDLSKVEQNTKYHPEGSVWNHTMMVVDEAAMRKDKSENPRAFMWASFLHDIGKAPTTKVRKGRITSYNHEKVGKDMAVKFLNTLGQDNGFIDSTVSLIRWHMEPLFILKELPFSNIKSMLREVSLDEIALLSLCDRFGRGDMSKEKMEDEEKGINTFKQRCREMESTNR